MDGDVRYFEWFAPVYDLVMPRADRERLRRGLDHAVGPVDRILDLGGGTGRAITQVAAPERMVLDPAKGMLRRVPPDVDRVRGSASALPFPSDTFDAVLIVDALHHMPATDRTLAESRRVLRPGGVVIVVDFDPTTIRGRLLVMAEHLIGFESVFNDPDVLAGLMVEADLDPTVLDRGFGYVVVGRVPVGS